MDYELRLQRLYERHLQPGDVAIDIGAHSGRHAVPMARRVGPAGYVYCFEPLAHVCGWLAGAFWTAEQAGESLARYAIFNCALGAANAQVTFVHAVDLPEYSGLRERVYDSQTRTERITVELRRLDDVFTALDRCDFIKIDAEGGELDILRGGERFVARTRPVVSFEFGANSIVNYGITPGDMFDFWSRLGYDVVDILGRGLDRTGFVDSAERQEVWDYVAVPHEHGDLTALLGSLPEAIAHGSARDNGD